jgi:hypothetical protein
MSFMFRHPLFRLSVFVTGFVLVVSSLAAGAQQNPQKRGRKYQAPPPTARIEVTVLRDVNSKPIENAAVIFHPMAGEKSKGNMELKSNEDGKAVIDVMLIGDIVRLQIIAKGFQTYGEDFKIDKPEMAIEIRMKRPGEQYSIYKDHSKDASTGQTPDAGKPAPAKDDAPAKDKPAVSTPPSDATSSQPQPK